jgi:hypothetical protein
VADEDDDGGVLGPELGDGDRDVVHVDNVDGTAISLQQGVRRIRHSGREGWCVVAGTISW